MLDFRFYLTNLRTGAKVEIEEPVGFDAFKPTLRRDPNFHGVGIEYTEERLGFYKKAYKLVTDEYKLNGVNSNMQLLIEYSTDGCRAWKEFYSGSLDFGNYEDERGEYKMAHVGVAQIGTWMDVNNRLPMKVDLDTTKGFNGADLPARPNLVKEITVPGKTVKVVNSAVGGTSLTNGSKASIARANMIFRLPVGDLVQDEFGEFNPDSEFMELGNKYEQPFFVNNEKGLAISNFSLYMNLNGVHFSNDATGGGASENKITGVVEVIIWDRKNTVVSTPYSYSFEVFFSGLSVPGKGIPIPNVDLSDLTIPAGGKVTATVTVSATTYSYNPRFELSGLPTFPGVRTDMTIYSQSPSTVVRQYMLHEALSRTVEWATGGEATVKSDYYGRTDSDINPTAVDGPGALRCITNGYLMRNATMPDGSRPPMSISGNELVNSLRAIDAVGYSYDRKNKVLVVEPIAYFYNDSVVLRCTDIDRIVREVDRGRCFNLLGVGYEKWEAEEWNGIDGFHGKRQYGNKITISKSSVEVYSQLIADSYAIEATRRKGMSEPNKDWRYDNNHFVLDLLRSGSGFSVTTGAGEEDSLIDPDTVFNVDLSPARMALRWFRWVMQGCLDNRDNGDSLKFTGAEGYAGAVTESYKNNSVIEGLVLESRDWEPFFGGRPYIKPELVKFKYPLSISGWEKLHENPHGMVEFEQDGVSDYGYIKEVEYDMTKGLASFTLFPKY